MMHQRTNNILLSSFALGSPSFSGALEGRLLRRLAKALVFLFGITWMAPTARALNVAPAWTEMWVQPGAEQVIRLTATNEGTQNVKVSMSTKEGIGTQTGGDLTVDKWITLKEPLEFVVKPGETHEVKAVVKCPQDSPAPQLSAMVSFSSRGSKESTVTSMISLPVYAFVMGLAKAEGTITEIMPFHLKDRLAVGMKVKNTGTIHLRVKGRGDVKDKKGTVIQHFELPPSVPVFASQERGYGVQMDWPEALKPGRYTIEAHLEAGDYKLEGVQGFVVKKNKEIVVDKKK